MPASSLLYTPAALVDRPSPRTERSSTTTPNGAIRSFGIQLSPGTSSAQVHLTSELLRFLSRVAASKPTSWLSGRSHILFHLAEFGDLSWRSGLFPSCRWTLSPNSCLPCFNSTGIQSLTGVGNLVGPLAQSVLYLRRTHTRPYLNTFRGEPAISEFDWPFTPIHSSSPDFSTSVGSVLHSVLPELQPGHG